MKTRFVDVESTSDDPGERPSRPYAMRPTLLPSLPFCTRAQLDEGPSSHTRPPSSFKNLIVSSKVTHSLSLTSLRSSQSDAKVAHHSASLEANSLSKGDRRVTALIFRDPATNELHHAKVVL